MQRRETSKIVTTAMAVLMAVSPIVNIAPTGRIAGAQTGPQAESRDRSRGQFDKLSQDQQEGFRRVGARVAEIELNDKNVPEWISGDLGPARGRPRDAALGAMRQLAPAFRMTQDDQLETTQKENTDDLGQTHVRLQQRYRGLRVIGGRVTVHMQKERVIGVNGNFVADIKVDEKPGLNAEAALDSAIRSIDAQAIDTTAKAELVILAAREKAPRLAWSKQVEFASEDGVPQIEIIFADAETGDLLARHPQVKTAKFRKVYSAGGTLTTPGTLQWQETSSFWSWLFLDAAGKGAATGTGGTYDYFHATFGRDSYDNAGAQLVSVVHYGSNVNNAFWSSSTKQMRYGDGDGVRFSPLSQSLDVTAHELTHAVTDATADLVYANESGALNEAMSDIFAACTEAYVTGAPDWTIGEDVFTPGTAGDALRYMYDPVLDDPNISSPDLVSSRDFYANRYTGAGDYGGVHINSGIANLAFYLLTTGGTHPRGKSTNVVPGIGINKAQRIFYRALTVYMDADDTFLDARNKTIKAAADLYGGSCSSEARAVKAAWSAVGVRPPILTIDPCLIIVFPFPPVLER
ncbi:MAG: M4 family metallopeptidase [Blastocatellia bacterium]